jgi:hypothetical protein
MGDQVRAAGCSFSVYGPCRLSGRIVNEVPSLVGLSDPFPPLLTAYVSVICHSGNRLFKLSLCPMISLPFARFAAPERLSVRGFASPK